MLVLCYFQGCLPTRASFKSCGLASRMMIFQLYGCGMLHSFDTILYHYNCLDKHGDAVSLLFPVCLTHVVCRTLHSIKKGIFDSVMIRSRLEKSGARIR